MSSYTFRPQDSASPDESEVRELYRQMLDGWNNCSADAFTVPFAEDGECISIVLFQNTPAQFHRRPELVQQMKEELRQLLT